MDFITIIIILWIISGFVGMNFILKHNEEKVTDKTPAMYILGMLGGLFTWIYYQVISYGPKD